MKTKGELTGKNTSRFFQLGDDTDVDLVTESMYSRGAKFTPLRLELPADMPLDDWAAIGRKLVRSDQVMQWWLGDWAAFGAGNPDAKGWRRHGQLKEFAEANGINYQTLRNLAWVSGRVEMSRRRDNVEWSKHSEVAALPAEVQEKWLAKTEAEDLPRAELRRQIRQSQGERNALEADGPPTKFVSKELDNLTHWLKSRPASFWDSDMKAVWKARLEPIVKFWEAL